MLPVYRSLPRARWYKNRLSRWDHWNRNISQTRLKLNISSKPRHLITAPRVFQIGFNRCGTKYLTRIFQMNGYGVKHWRRGELAEEIFLAKELQRKPFEQWSDTQFFGDMESVDKFHKPFLEGFKEYKFLHSWYPDAYFILNVRDPEAWVASRANHHNGQYIKFHVQHRSIDEHLLPAQWLIDWHEHLSGVRNYFAGNVRFIEYNIDSDPPENLQAHFQEHFTLRQFPKQNTKRMQNRRAASVEVLSAIRLSPNCSSTGDNRNTRFELETVEHCVGHKVVGVPENDKTKKSRICGQWDGGKRVWKKDGNAWGLTRCRLSGFDAFIASEKVDKINRLQGALNDCLKLKRSGALTFDMEDARKHGMPGVQNPSNTLITYNRRPEASNLVLWPLPGYHDIGLETFAHNKTPDSISFDEKLDMVGWRGNLTGRSLFQQGRLDGRPSRAILNDLMYLKLNEYEQDKLIEELMGVPRFEVVMRYFANPDFNLAFTLPPRFSRLEDADRLGAFCSKRQSVSWFYRFKYILCLSGYDTASNFFVAANSNSVVFKETDGWELFYTKSFRPWEHFIPINPGGDDIEEKLEWARSHPSECKEMVQASQTICSLFASQQIRSNILNGILDNLV